MLRRMGSRLLSRSSRSLDSGPTNVPLPRAIKLDEVDMRQPPARPNETLEESKRRLQYQSAYRGMAEMDYIMGTFAARYLSAMSKAETDEWELIVRQYDSELYKWILQDKEAEAPKDIREGSLWPKLKEHGKNAAEYR